jgi:hypothetical protein
LQTISFVCVISETYTHDFSAGDVEMTTTVEAATTTDETTGVTVKSLTGLTGRTLTIPDSWPAARDGQYKLGWKNAKDLFPGEVMEKLNKVGWGLV